MPRATAAVFAAFACLSIACGGNAPTAAPTPEPWSPPPDWATVASIEGGVHLTLPPWLEVFDNSGAIFANEAPPDPFGQIPMQLMAFGPGADEQPLPGQDLAAWITARLAREPGKGVPVITRVTLPSGPAVRFDRTDRTGTLQAWRFLVYAIRTPRGAAFLQFDGPPDGWPARLEDLERVARLAWFR